jgi:protein translocase SecG subunit
VTISVLFAAAAPAAPAVPHAGASAVPGATSTLSPQVMQQLQNFAFLHHSPLATNYPWLTHTFAGIALVAAVSLVGLLAVQTTKQEGLSGTIGGRVESAYRPRLGFDQQLARLTGIVAITFVVFTTIVSLSGI